MKWPWTKKDNEVLETECSAELKLEIVDNIPYATINYSDDKDLIGLLYTLINGGFNQLLMDVVLELEDKELVTEIVSMIANKELENNSNERLANLENDLVCVKPSEVFIGEQNNEL